ncbi:MAG TPA: SUMF1/EgtB/PvdO family nonheme iron enzyme [Kiritimatiellia bacterium]|nr:SUMF1/EgtB/PvdO family nonheme iron enzyme [Kiritimatiellia bacterium]
MKKMLFTLFATCVAVTSVSLAQDPDTSDYAVIDLSEGSAAVSYPISYMTSVPAGGWTNDLAYVTNKLVLRKIVETNGTFYYMGVFELTRGQLNCLRGTSYSDPQLPVTGAQHPYTDGSLNEALQKSGLLFTFPTQAQWEYACRAGTTTSYHFEGGTDDPASLGDYAWYVANSGGNAHEVGQKLPNPWGLYDLYGNVAELCVGNVARGGYYASAAGPCSSSGLPYSFGAFDTEYGYRVCARLPLLTVNGGTGGGNHLKGTTNTVAWTPVAHHNFLYWQVDPPSVTNAQGLGEAFSDTNATTTVVMPFADVTLTAITEPILYPLTVVNGSGSGSYTNGQIITITANPTNTLYFKFTQWTGDTHVLAETTNATTTVTMPGYPVTVTANYGDKRYALTVNFASGGGNYTNGQEVTIGSSTTPPTAGHEFDHWEGDTATVADVNSAPTTFRMGATNMTLTAIFRPKVVPQNTYLAFNLTDNTASYSDAPPVGGWTDQHKTTQMVFRKISAGSFTMGSASGQPGETQHAVTLTRDFYLGIFEVTQKQWEEIRGTKPSFFTGDTLPVERVYYSDIRGNNDGKNWPADNKVDYDSFMGRLRPKSPVVSAADLPTEAQWEYACRAGTTGDYAGPVDALGWHAGNTAPARTQVVGSKQPNPWGLYDMHGNVWEVCLDWYKMDLGAAAQTDPAGPDGVGPRLPPLRVMRGGAYNEPAEGLRSAIRQNMIATNQLAGGGSATNLALPYGTYGFRVALPQSTTSFELTVVGGEVNTSGVFTVGTKIGLSPAPAPAGMKFGAWQVNPVGMDLGAGFSPTNQQPLLTMPAANLTITAIYIPEDSSGLFRFVQNNPGASVESWRANGETFTITAPAATPGYRFSTWTVTPAAYLGAGFVSTDASTTVVMPAVDVTVIPTYVLNVPDPIVATPTAGVAFTLDAGAGIDAAKFSASGLPRGLRIDNTTGTISGVPSRPGDYVVTITAQYADGTTVTYDVAFTVEPLSPELQGSFTGYCYAEDSAGQRHARGLVTLRATKAGRLTAKVSLQRLNLSFSAKSWSGMTSETECTVTMERRQGERFDLTADSATGLVEGKLTGGSLGDALLSIVAQRNAFQDRNDVAAQEVLATYKGYYTVALPTEVCETDPAIDNQQSGSGYVTLTVRNRGVVRVAGKMADGTRVSQSTTLFVDDYGAYVPLFVRLYARRGVFAGLLQLDGGTQPTDLKINAEPTVLLEWIYPGSTMLELADRFDAQLSAIGAYYDSLTDLQAAYAGMFLQTEEIAMPLVAGRTAGSLVIDPAIDNPQAVKFRVTRRSGLFSGSFRTLNEAGRTVTLRYAGVLTRDGDFYIGDGAYVEQRTINKRRIKSSHRIWIDTPAP